MFDMHTHPKRSPTSYCGVIRGRPRSSTMTSMTGTMTSTGRTHTAEAAVRSLIKKGQRRYAVRGVAIEDTDLT